MLRSKLGELWRRLVLKRDLVGVDEKLNKYYTWRQRDYKGEVENKREVQMFEVPRDMASYDPSTIPIEWRSWLNGHRRVPPTPEQSAQLQEYRDNVRKNALAVDEKEQQQRLKKATLSTKVDGPDMDAFLHQLGNKGQTGGQDDSERTDAADQIGRATKGSTGEATGGGDTFTPGQWNPGKS